MSTLNDLKSSGSSDFSPSINEVPERGFVPSIEMEEDKVDPKAALYANKRNVYKERLAEKAEQSAPQAISMTTGKPIQRTIPSAAPRKPAESTHEFKPADLSSLPKYRPGEEEIVNPKPRDRVTEVFSKGGDFDKYIERKKKEFNEFNHRMAMEAELNGKPLVNMDGTPVSQEEINALTGESSDSSSNNYDEVDIMNVNEMPMDEATVQETIPVRERPARVDNTVATGHIDEIPELEEDDFEPEQIEEEITPDKEEVEEESFEEPTFDEEIDEPVMDHEELYPEKPETVTSEETTVGADDNFEIETGYIQEGERVTGDTVEEEQKEVEAASTENDIEKRREILKNLVRQKIKPAVKRIDLSSYTIAKVGTTDSINLNQSKHVSVVKWPLINTGICVKMKEFSGQDLERLRQAIDGNDSRTVMKMIYDHITSPKPADVDAWMKSIAFEDYDHLFFAIYCASFVGANYLPIECSNKSCPQKTYVTDDIPFMSMVKFEDDKAKKNFYKIYKEDPIEAKGMFPAEVVAISENYAIAFVVPSIYSTLSISDLLDDDFLNKYRNTVSYIPYIDTIYQIDKASHSLVPIDWKKYANNEGKTLKSRVIRYEHILNSMTIDEIAAIDGCMEALNSKTTGVTYQYPEVTCPYCHAVTKAERMGASVMVFRRSQLGRLATL